jgi:hypothetical protein
MPLDIVESFFQMQNIVKLKANKNIMVEILLAEKALLKSPYVKRYIYEGVKAMQTPWNGEKVSGFVRALSWGFIACAIFAFGEAFYFGILKGEGFSIEGGISDYLKLFFGLISACYIFLLFSKVALTGFAPKTWIPWR